MLLDSHLAAGRKQRRAMLEDTVDVELVKGEQAVRARRATLGAFNTPAKHRPSVAAHTRDAWATAWHTGNVPATSP
jgi:hypothetical protein